MTHPLLYQINTRAWLTRWSRTLGRPATLDDVPESELDLFARLGFDWIWLLGVWRTGAAGREISRSQPSWRQEFRETLPDLQEEDIAGSCFAVAGYDAHPDLGGDAALARFRQRLRGRGLKLMLDFVPNHVAPDHPWTKTHPDYFVQGPDGRPAQGRDPNYPAWPDTLQLDYANPAVHEAMAQELEAIARRCDGVRCDMAMLLLPEVFERTWGRKPAPFWPAAIQRVREQAPGFLFMAEAYWELEWTLQQQGFDFAYDKRLYDRLREGFARPVREHLQADIDYQAKLARFLENHDEPRAAAVFDPCFHRAAAVVAYTLPGLRFFHQGQAEGRKKRISPHLVRAPAEPLDAGIQDFYDHLLDILRQPALRSGVWQRLEPRPGWEGNESWDAFVAHAWQGADGRRIVVAVNFAPHESQCYLRLPFPECADGTVRLRDLLGAACYDREGHALLEHGLYLAMHPWHYHVFSVERLP